MKPSALRLAIAAWTAGALVAAACAFPHRIAEFGSTLWDSTSGETRPVRDDRSPDALERESAEVRGRIAVKEEVVRELADERMTLFEAAAVFRDLSGHHRIYQQAMERMYPGLPRDEQVCRNVIEFTRVAVAETDPDRAVVIAAVLEAELDDHKQRYGGIKLPW